MLAIIVLAAAFPIGLLVSKEYVRFRIARLRWGAVKFVAVGALAVVAVPFLVGKLHEAQALAQARMSTPGRPTPAQVAPSRPRTSTPVTYSQLPYMPPKR